MTTGPAVPDRTVPLPSGAGMPLLGFGTWQLTGKAATQAVEWALETGYRHLDTATMYRNEGEIGAVLATSGIQREDVFITTKLPPSRADSARPTLQASLDALGADYVDLWLIHAPPDRAGGIQLWREFVEARDAGLVRDIGVSNYSLAQLDSVTEATGVAPAVNQIEWSPLLHDPEVLVGHRERGVVLEGYSGLLGGVLQNPVVTDIAGRLGRTPAQVVIRWHLQHDIVVIPKSGRRERIESNADVAAFELRAADMAALDGLARG